MSEVNTVKSAGVLKTISGKKYRGTLVASETGAAFYEKGKDQPLVEWNYTRLHRMDNIRRGGTSSQVTIILKDDSRYIFDLDYGLKVYNHMDQHWADKPVTPRTRGDELHRLAELRGEKIQVPKKHLITRRHPNRSIGGDIGIYLLLALIGLAMVFPGNLRTPGNRQHGSVRSGQVSVPGRENLLRRGYHVPDVLRLCDGYSQLPDHEPPGND